MVGSVFFFFSIFGLDVTNRYRYHVYEEGTDQGSMVTKLSRKRLKNLEIVNCSRSRSYKDVVAKTSRVTVYYLGFSVYS